jgi:putative hydrolase of the HAD superfamily
MPRTRPTALLIDLDGVLRRWDPAVPAAIEAAHGLAPGALHQTAMEWSRYLPAVTGAVTHADWMAGVARVLGDAAVAEWQAYRGEVDTDVLAFVREVRALGVPVALATNATDRLDADLAALGLTGEVDHVVNSSVVGAHKPTREFFTAACLALRTPPDRVLFVDDSDRLIRGARVAGLPAYRWTGHADLRYLRAIFVIEASVK